MKVEQYQVNTPIIPSKSGDVTKNVKKTETSNAVDPEGQSQHKEPRKERQNDGARPEMETNESDATLAEESKGKLDGGINVVA